MTAVRCVGLIICSFGIAPALAAPVPLGDPFHVRHGESVELTHGVRLKFVDVHEGRCGGTCAWQGEAEVEIELQAKGQTARGSITTEKRNRILLAHGVKLLGLYPGPGPRDSEERPAKEYVALFRVADAAPASAKAFTSRAAAMAAADRYVGAYARAANQVCADWRQRQFASYIQDSGDLCEVMSQVSRTAHALSEDASIWNFYFTIGDPPLRTKTNETVSVFVTMSKASKDAFHQVRESGFVALPCDVTLLADAHGGCNASPR